MSDKGRFVPISLPSKGLVYQDVDMSKVMIRPFVGKDEQLVAELTLDNLSKKFLTIIENVIQGIDPKKLTSGDAKHIMLWEALNSYDNKYRVSIVCENCLETSNVVVDIGKIDSKELPDDFKQPHEVKLSDKIVMLRLLTLEDEIATFDFAKRSGSSYLYSLATTIVDKDVPVIGRMKMLEEMNTKDLNKIKRFHDKFMHGPDMITEYICPLCGYEGKLELPFRVEELFQFSE